MDKNDIVRKVNKEIKNYRTLLHDIEKEYDIVERSLKEQQTIIDNIENINFAEATFLRSEGDNYAGATYYRYSLKIDNVTLTQDSSRGNLFELTKEQCQYIVENNHLYVMDNLKSYVSKTSIKRIELLTELKQLEDN